jgi:hypothetical protein
MGHFDEIPRFVAGLHREQTGRDARARVGVDVASLRIGSLPSSRAAHCRDEPLGV